MSLEERFERACSYLRTVTSELSSEELLKFYSLYKQATEGPCNAPQPYWYEAQAKRKWEAWKRLGDMSGEEAMNNYVSALTEVRPTWEEDSDDSKSQGWAAFSRFADTEEELDDEDKTFLDWVKDGDEQMVQKILSTDPKLVNLIDDQGLLPIHWAADRGYVTIMKHLIDKGADVKARDVDGRTPLHYAVSCGHLDTVKFLLSCGVQSIDDNSDTESNDVITTN